MPPPSSLLAAALLSALCEPSLRPDIEVVSLPGFSASSDFKLFGKNESLRL